MFAPAKTPADVMNKLNTDINAALADPSIKDKLLIQGIVPQPMNVEEFTKFVRSESDKFKQIAKTADIKVEN
jgi:tripartite-type tricarboxylate transporter receptor subunit TctC